MVRSNLEVIRNDLNQFERGNSITNLLKSYLETYYAELIPYGTLTGDTDTLEHWLENNLGLVKKELAN